MENSFRQWSKLKIRLHFDNRQVARYKEGEVWWTSIGQNIGSEENGKGQLYNRPVLIVKGFSRELFWGIPLSTTTKRGKYYYAFDIKGKTSVALLSHMKPFDTKRLGNKYGVLEKDELPVIIEKIYQLIREE